MGKKLRIDIDLEEIESILGAIFGTDNVTIADEESEDEAEETPAPKKGKGKKAAEPEESEDEAEETDDEAEAEESEGPTREEVIDAVKAYVGKNKKGEREKAVALLKKKFGTGNVQKLDEEHFAAVIKLFTK